MVEKGTHHKNKPFLITVLNVFVRQTERSEVCTHDRGQDSPVQTDLARLIRCLLCDKNKNNLIRVM